MTPSLTRRQRRISPVRLALGLCTVVACSSSDGSHPSLPPDVPPAKSDPPGAVPSQPATEGKPDESSPTGPAQVLLVGRFDTTDPRGPKASWPGTRILTRFEGSAISVTLSESAHPWMEGAPSYWDVAVDHGPVRTIAMTADEQPRVFELATKLPPGPHEIELYKRSEMQTGVTQFLGFDLHGGKPLPPPPRQKRKIEVMGDSFATGFGVENIDAPGTDCPGADWGGIWENFRKSWGAILGVKFDAEVHGIVYSGKGLLRNVWPTDDDALRDYYPRSNPDPERANDPPLFDLQSWIPDVIVLTQGSCDMDGGASSAELESAYRDFVVNRLRARGQNIHILMGVVGNGARGEVAHAAQRIIAERAALGDDKMHAFTVKPYTWDEMTACNGHGTPAWHQRVATELAETIHDILGW